MHHQFKELADVDITAEPMEVGPTCHYVMGGVEVDPETAATSVPGLFAAGEVAGGMHGANRLGGNSLSDLLVFGQRTGGAAAAFANGIDDEPWLDPASIQDALAELAAPLQDGEGESPYRIHEELQEAMQSRVGIFRTADDLDDAINALDAIRARWPNIRVSGGRAYNPSWNLVFEVRNMLIAAEAVARSARQREESRGAHSRIDFPDLDEKWGRKNSVVRLGVDGMEVGTSKLPKLSAELETLLGKEAH
jgi:succinate dehydrogenase / fumarate reductase flavoprotein subunit